jgi:hypothetical protein
MCLYSSFNLQCSQIGPLPCSHPILTSETIIFIDVWTENPSVGFPLPFVSHNTGLSFRTQWAVSPHSKIRPNAAYFWCCARIILHYFWFWFSSTTFTSGRWRFLLKWSSNLSVTFLVIIASIMRSVLKCFKNYIFPVSWNDHTQRLLISRTFLSFPARCQFSTVLCAGLRKNQTVFSDTACTSVG